MWLNLTRWGKYRFYAFIKAEYITWVFITPPEQFSKVQDRGGAENQRVAARFDPISVIHIETCGLWLSHATDRTTLALTSISIRWCMCQKYVIATLKQHLPLKWYFVKMTIVFVLQVLVMLCTLSASLADETKMTSTKTRNGHHSRKKDLKDPRRFDILCSVIYNVNVSSVGNYYNLAYDMFIYKVCLMKTLG